jgi:hypothetical protein
VRALLARVRALCAHRELTVEREADAWVADMRPIQHAGERPYERDGEGS